MKDVKNVPTYAHCPHHGAEYIQFNTSTEFYVCKLAVTEGDPGYNKYCTAFGMHVCTWQIYRQAKAV